MIQRWACRAAGTHRVRNPARMPSWVYRVKDALHARYAVLRDTHPVRECNVTSRSDRFVAQDKRDARKHRNGGRAAR